MNYFCADTHFGHANIVAYCNRPYSNTDEMDEAIFANLEALPTDCTLWILGDVAMRGSEFAEGIAKRLASLPYKIKILGGNHDKGKTKIYQKHGLLEHKSGRAIYDIDGLKVSMGHYPMTDDEVPVRGSLYLHGHVHDKFKFKTFGTFENWHINCNVGVDVWGMKPVTMEQILKEREEFHTNLFNK